ncbi:hypothetical protein KKG63_03535 [Patescibacteria group bacterium]|nr:hypothetical protein [Patescibacteria group bacterium]MBU1999457.1 hypothetical protein [Candidatus Omnitrophota bacterium]
MATKNKVATFEEKATQVKEILPEIEKVDPLEIFNPQGVKFSLKDRSYILYPLPLRKLSEMQRLGQKIMVLASADSTKEDMSQILLSIAETVAKILDAPQDTEFLFENLTQPMLEWIFKTTAELSQGINRVKNA